MSKERRGDAIGERASTPAGLHVTFDVTRLFARSRRPAPSGIDRVMVEAALTLLREPRSQRSFMVIGESGEPFGVPEWSVRGVVAHLRMRWGYAPTGAYERCLAMLMRLACKRKAVLDRLMRGVRRPWSRQNTVVLNAGHKNLDSLKRLREGGAWTAVLVHDILPISRPADFSPALCSEFRAGLEQALTTADLIIANSESTAEDIERQALTAGLRLAPIIVVPLAGNRLGADTPSPVQTGSDYFVAVGGFESRKNIRFLLKLWQELSRTGPAPKLYLVCGGDRQGAEALREIAPPGVEVVSTMNDPQLIGLLRGARALLAPSEAEGFGLPVVEALQNGTPVLCSDIPVFREVGRGVPEFLAVCNLPAWATMIRAYCADSGSRASQLDRLQRTVFPTWNEQLSSLFSQLTLLGSAELGIPRAGTSDSRVPTHSMTVPAQRSADRPRESAQALVPGAEGLMSTPAANDASPWSGSQPTPLRGRTRRGGSRS